MESQQSVAGYYFSSAEDFALRKFREGVVKKVQWNICLRSDERKEFT